jgi:hypothetical protein
MKAGDKIHKALEKELHDIVPLTQVTSHEDIWGLKFLNILFGLHELQVHGMTVSLGISVLIVERVSRLWIHRESPCRRYHRSNSLRSRGNSRPKAHGCFRRPCPKKETRYIRCQNANTHQYAEITAIAHCGDAAEFIPYTFIGND